MNETAFILGSVLVVGYYFYRVLRERAGSNRHAASSTHDQNDNKI